MESRWFLRNSRHKDLLTNLCLQRGIDPKNIEPKFEDLLDPFLLPDMNLAVDIATRVINTNGLIVIFGDYDADGTPAAALLSLVFKYLGIDHQVILPTRESGYGLKIKDIERLPTQTKLLITVDTGITSVKEIKLATSKGIEVIVLDHHIPKAKLPQAAVVDPLREDSTYDFKGLCGCALAYKFIEGLSSRFPKISLNYRKWLLDLVAISTVADMMPIKGENRVFVHYGLKVLRQNRRPGLRQLLKYAAIDLGNITATTLGFAIGPRLNASGRLSDNRPAYELLISESDTVAASIASEIEENNRTRQLMVTETLEQAKELLEQQNSLDDHFFFVHRDNWPSGVVGLVAGKLVNQYNRPVIVTTGMTSNTFTGSGRSPQNFSLIDSLKHVDKYLLTYGGHRQAAGLSVSQDNYESIKAELKKLAAHILSPDDMKPIITADSEIPVNDLSISLVDTINKLSPFGIDNNRPTFLLRELELGSPKLMGRNSNHIKWQLNSNNDQNIEVVAFNFPSHFQTNNQKVDLIGSIELNEWNGRQSLQLKVLDLAKSGKEVQMVD